MRSRGVGEESLSVKHKELVYSVGKYLVLHLVLDTCAGNNGVEFHAQLVGKFAALGEQFLRNLLHLGVFYFAIYEYVVHNRFLNFEF